MMNKLDLWENDPTLVPMTPERARRIKGMQFEYVRSSGGPVPGMLDPADNDAYAHWLATGEIMTKDSKAPPPRKAQPPMVLKTDKPVHPVNDASAQFIKSLGGK